MRLYENLSPDALVLIRELSVYLDYVYFMCDQYL